MNSPLSGMQQAIQIKGAGKPSLEKKAYQELRKQIINAVYQPGTLLSENELADTLGMSRTPIRAAISLLETEGFLESVRDAAYSSKKYRSVSSVKCSRCSSLCSYSCWMSRQAAGRPSICRHSAPIWRGKARRCRRG